MESIDHLAKGQEVGCTESNLDFMFKHLGDICGGSALTIWILARSAYEPGGKISLDPELRYGIAPLV